MPTVLGVKMLMIRAKNECEWHGKRKKERKKNQEFLSYAVSKLSGCDVT